MILDQVFKEQDGEGSSKGLVEQKVRGEKEKVTEKERRDRKNASVFQGWTPKYVCLGQVTRKSHPVQKRISLLS